MNIFKIIFGKLGSRVWFITSVTLVILFTIISVLLVTVFYDVFVSFLGGQRAIYAEGTEAVYEYDSRYDTKAKTFDAANSFNEQICEEGFILLKNNNDALPLYTPESKPNKVSVKPKISVFGKNSVNFAYGGSGSGGSGGSDGFKNLYDSLREAGYETNPKLENFYNSSDSGTPRPEKPAGSNLDDGKAVTIPTYETPQLNYPDDVKNSYNDYNDAALVVFTRMGGEGFDLPQSMTGTEGARKDDDHYLQLDQNETDMLAAVCSSNFGHVIVILNVGTSMELAFLEDPDYYAYQSKIDAAIWTGFPGNSGIMALGRILNGNVNPSGRTVNTYAADFKNDPTWNNFSENRKNGGDQYTVDGVGQDYFFVDYEEGIYVGYRYYETRGAGNTAWYEENVIYPFGYGLSYTKFEWEIEDKSEIENVAITKTGKYTVKIKVTNNGGVAGKEVVQLYGHAPTTLFGIEKPHEVLLDFKKTDLIEPGQSKTVELTFDPYYLASYDYNNRSRNSFNGYELEGRTGYELYVNIDAHNSVFKIPFRVDSDILFDKDPVTGTDVINRYTGNDNAYFDSNLQLSKELSRYEWDESIPKSRNDNERNIDRDFINSILKDTTHNNPNDFSDISMPKSEEPVTIMFRDMMTDADGNYGFANDSIERWKPFVSYDDDRWAQMLDQCVISDLLSMYDYGAFKSADIKNISKPLTNDTDGPAGFVNFMLKDGTYYGTCYYACQIVIASTWSQEVAENFGIMVGNEGIWGADGKGNGMPYSGWYAPGANIHRSPFGGRNFEYMSEDGLFSGKMAAAQIRGAQSKGVYCFMKHFAINDQETHRSSNGLAVWVTEQAMREIYLKPFEIAVKEGGTRAIMSSFNRIGTRWAGGDYRLLTEILRNEWGFKGTVICDFNSGSYMNPKQMAYAGGDLNLNNQGQYEWKDFNAQSVADVTILRRCAKNIFYTVMNSNAMNGEIIGYNLPYWIIWLIVIDCVIAAGLAVWGFLAIRSAIKQLKEI